jgi:MFS family permease
VSTWGEQIRESRAAIAGVVRNPGLRRLNLALVGSVIGDWAYAVAASVYAYTQGGATAVGVLGVIRYVSVAVVTPFASVLADRHDRRRVMIVADAVRAVLVLAAAAIIEADGPAVAVYVLAVVVALVGTPFRPAQAALLPQLAERADELTAANVASSTIESVGFFAGPALAGLLLAVTDTAAVYAFDALTFVWSAVVVLGLRLPAEASAAASDPRPGDGDGDEPDAGTEPDVSAGFLRESMAGYREILRSRELRLLIGLYCAQTLIAGASVVFIVAIALDLLELGDGGVGLLEATLGVGGLIGGLVALVLSRRERLAFDFGIGVALWAAPLILVAAWPALPAALVAMAMIGMANSLVDINASTLLQRLVPDAVMGRVFGAMDSAVIGGMALGAALMPVLLHTIGLRAGLAVLGGAVTALVALGVVGAGAHRPAAPCARRYRGAAAGPDARRAARTGARAARTRVAGAAAGRRGGRVPRGRGGRPLLRDRTRSGRRDHSRRVRAVGDGRRQLRRDRPAPRRPAHGHRHRGDRHRRPVDRPRSVPAGRHRTRCGDRARRAAGHLASRHRLTLAALARADQPRRRAPSEKTRPSVAISTVGACGSASSPRNMSPIANTWSSVREGSWWNNSTVRAPAARPSVTA